MIQLLGFGDTKLDSQVSGLVDGFLAKSPNPSVDELTAFLKLLSGEERDAATRILVTRGVHPMTVSTAMAAPRQAAWSTFRQWAPIVAAAAAGIHGYRRNDSILWGLWYFAWASIFPIATSALTIAQGWGVSKKASI